jgi:hypothetical protein
MLYARKPALLLTALSALSVLALLTTPLAFADEDHGHRGRPGDAQLQQVGTRDNDANDDDRDDEAAATNAADARLQRLITVINADVPTLTNLRIGDADADADDLRLEDVRTVSLATIDSRLNSTQASMLTNAVNANSSALQTFLNGGSSQATAIDNALNAAGISPSSALVVLPLRDHRLIVITS